jgi:small subunit ribosomal protein S15
MLTKRVKTLELKKVQKHDTDTGSAPAQIALISRRIIELSAHLKKNNNDKHSRKGLLGLVAQRRRHMKYLESTDMKTFKAVLKNLGLK